MEPDLFSITLDYTITKHMVQVHMAVYTVQVMATYSLLKLHTNPKIQVVLFPQKYTKLSLQTCPVRSGV